MDNNFNDNTNQSSKDNFVQIDFKDGSKKFKEFISSFFTNPIGLIKKISQSNDTKFFNVSSLLLLIWLIITLIHSLFGNTLNYHGSTYIFAVIGDLTIPILSVGFISLIIHSINPNQDDEYRLTKTLTLVIACKIPIIISNFISLLTLVSSKANFLTIPIYYFCFIISTILTFFAVKYLYKESDDSKSFKRFLIIESIFYVIYLLLSFLNIYLV